jgi:hypothetical protein
MVERKGRTLFTTVNNLMESPRLKIAVENFNTDPMLLKAILIELGKECLDVAKNTIIKHYNTHSSLPQYALSPYLRSVDEFNTFNIYWNLSDEEKAYYTADPLFKLSKEERQELFKKIKKRFMQTKD